MKRIIFALLLVCFAVPAHAGQASTYRALEDAVLMTVDNAGRDVECHFYGLDGAAFSGLLVNTTRTPDDDGNGVAIHQDLLPWRVAPSGVIVIAEGHFFIRSEGVLYRIQPGTQTLKPTPVE